MNKDNRVREDDPSPSADSFDLAADEPSNALSARHHLRCSMFHDEQSSSCRTHPACCILLCTWQCFSSSARIYYGTSRTKVLLKDEHTIWPLFITHDIFMTDIRPSSFCFGRKILYTNFVATSFKQQRAYRKPYISTRISLLVAFLTVYESNIYLREAVIVCFS